MPVSYDFATVLQNDSIFIIMERAHELIRTLTTWSGKFTKEALAVFSLWPISHSLPSALSPPTRLYLRVTW